MANTPHVAPETTESPTEDGPNPRTRLVKRTLVITVVVLITAMWIYAFIEANKTPAERMDDTAVAQQSETICAATAAQLAALPPAFEMATAADRAAVIDESDVELAAMIAQLRTLTPTSEPDRFMYTEWLKDWDTFLGDRANYADQLRADPNARFYVTAKDKDQITDPIDQFAKANRMPSCASPQDVG